MAMSDTKLSISDSEPSCPPSKKQKIETNGNLNCDKLQEGIDKIIAELKAEWVGSIHFDICPSYVNATKIGEMKSDEDICKFLGGGTAYKKLYFDLEKYPQGESEKASNAICSSFYKLKLIWKGQA